MSNAILELIPIASRNMLILLATHYVNLRANLITAAKECDPTQLEDIMFLWTNIIIDDGRLLSAEVTSGAFGKPGSAGEPVDSSEVSE